MENSAQSQQWENLVQKQLKTTDINTVLQKENLENLIVLPYYSSTLHNVAQKLPMVEESTHLVAKYHPTLQDHTYAFLLENNITDLEDKSLFINNLALAEHIIPEEYNTYFSLIDVIDEEKFVIKDQLAKELLAKDFQRNIAVDVVLHQNSGASIIQQLAIALAKTKELIDQYGAAIFPKIITRFAIGHQYFFEISKLRAFKLLYNQLSKEYDLDDIPYLFAETTLRNKSTIDVENNLIRSSLEIAAAMIGGADAVFSNIYLVENQNPISEEISYKQEIILAYESIINVFQDAGNGSYLVEDLTQQLVDKSWKYFLEIEDCGGYLACLQSGKIQQEIYEHAILEQQWIKEGKIKLTGVNLYPTLPAKKNVETMYSPSQMQPIRWAEMFE